MDIKAAAELFRHHNVDTVRIGGADIDGVYRGKRVSAKHFLDAALGEGFPQCDVIFGWDIQDTVIGALPYSNWETGFGDILMRPDLSTLAVVPWEEGSASCVCDFHTEDGEPLAVSPRFVLQRVLDRAREAGFRAVMAAELEVRFFREDQHSLREKGFSNLTPLNPGDNCYSIHHASVDEPVIGRVRRLINEYGIPVDSYNREHGAGMYEINLRHTDALRAADQTMLYKSGAKEIAGLAGALPTFMAKYADGVDGCGGHLHQSLWRGDESAFWEDGGDGHLTPAMKHYIAGLLATAPEFMLLYAPNVNSYKRYRVGAWTPVNLTWGMDNRTAALRVIASSPDAIRIENRIPGADLNPYLAFAASLAGGLHGIENALNPPPPTRASAYDVADAPPLPRTLDEALQRFRASALARQWFGDPFVDQYAAFRAWEVEQHRQAVTDWERRRYFEMV
jgi:glutamine synthetase